MAGIYIHIPFCKQKCSYCDFHFTTTFNSYRSKMIECMLQEIEIRKGELKGETIETIYFGGGTPSLLEENEINQFIKKIKSIYKLSEDIEFTLEANPDDISEEKVQFWKEAGINRLSIGVQSFDDEDLRWMNRAHNAQESLQAIKIAQKCEILNISIDLIYGLPNMDLKRWKSQLNMAIDLNVAHISAYCLTVEEKTLLHKLVKNKKIIPADNEIQSQHFEILQKKLSDTGFIQYEISNFGKEGYFSKHNSSYWKGKKYQGIGPSAHSFDLKSRFWNLSNNQSYIKALSNQQLCYEKEALSNKDLFNELLLTGLRTIWGVSIEKLKQLQPFSEEFLTKMDDLLLEKKANIQNEHLVLTPKGMLFADAITQDLFLEK